MYNNRLYFYLTENNLFYNSLDFKKDIPLTILLFNSQIMFDEKKLHTRHLYRSDTVNHKILLRKLSHYGIKNRGLDWFTCYLSNRKQFIGYNVNSKSTCYNVNPWIAAGIHSWTLAILALYKRFTPSIKIMRPYDFANDTNLFYLGKDIHSLFNTVNNKLPNISHWFNSNTLFLNSDKTKFTLFHRVRERDNIPLVLPTLKINNTFIKQVDYIKFLGVLFDENVT